MSKWILTGTRYDRDDVEVILDQLVTELGRPSQVIAGDQRGVDARVINWAISRGIDWIEKEVNRSLGSPYMYLARNQNMADEGNPEEGDICIAFPHKTKRSDGTLDCVRRCKKRGLKIIWK